MTRPTRIVIDTTALLHNLRCVKRHAPTQKIIAMLKANAYGCGIASVLPTLSGHVDAVGVASLDEALVVRALGFRDPCVVFQGVFSAEEWTQVAYYNLECILHNAEQLQWLLANQLISKVKIWIKVDTGMHRLGFMPQAVAAIVQTLLACPWVDHDIGLLTHLACADDPKHVSNHLQWQEFIQCTDSALKLSVANSAAILSSPYLHADVVRPGIMLYGVSPFTQQTGVELGLMPVMQFVSTIIALHNVAAGDKIGYGATYNCDRTSLIGVIPVGYGDGYPRVIKSNTQVWINGNYAPIVGRVSMDMLMIDVTDIPCVKIGDFVELWGRHVPVEQIAAQANTIAYELLCRIAPRVRQ